jgi:hypothetical protein
MLSAGGAAAVSAARVGHDFRLTFSGDTIGVAEAYFGWRLD